MDDVPASDNSLLQRLNALKPSSVSLSGPPSSSETNPASTIERAKPPSKEDALTTRLKSLRNQTNIDQDNGVGESTQPHAAQEPQPLTSSKLGIQHVPTPTQVTDDDVDPLLFTDDQTLEELLDDLRSDESWLDEVAAEEEEHQRVTALLNNLSKSSSVNDKPDKQDTGGDDASSDDDSEGESMATEADYVLAKAMDEVEWEKINKPPSPPHQPTPKPTEDTNQHPPQDSAIPTSNDSPFNLPAVPSKLQDQLDSPTPATQTQSDVDFAASIASRMAALKLSGSRALPSAPTDAVDSLGLPQAPTFAPADRPVPGLVKRTGLTDEDEKTWCVVCLEDGAVHCLGCEAGDNVYCARCWKEMHVGPQAGYDERGHKWETFVLRPR
ncbi:hypothetical protein GGR51DRAFT_539533 [Nemania sp. FL0031]|nr:hypothetical protein GGR51DRAFT_539533 [Nemania sp. FL0031]